MHTVLLPLHRGRTGRTCPPATLLLLVTAPGLGETITACRFSNFNLWVVSSARVAKLCTSYNAAAGRVFGSNLGCMKYHRHVASIKSRCGLDHLGSRCVVCWTSIVLCLFCVYVCNIAEHFLSSVDFYIFKKRCLLCHIFSMVPGILTNWHPTRDFSNGDLHFQQRDHVNRSLLLYSSLDIDGASARAVHLPHESYVL